MEQENQEQQRQERLRKLLFVDKSFTHKKIIKYMGEELEFEFKEISGFEKDKMGKEATTVNSKTGKVEIDPAIANIAFLKASIVKAPFEINDYNLQNMREDLRDMILDTAREINIVSKELEKK